MSSRTRAARLLLGLLVLGVAAPPGFVVCVAEGDHVAIETACEFRPCGAPTELADCVFGAVPVESCTDTPLVGAVLRTSADPAWVAPPSAALTAPAPRAASAVRSLRAEGCSDTLHGDLRAIRTIVLIV